MPLKSLILKLIFFQNDQAVGSGFKVQFLASYLENQAPFVLTEEGNGKAIGLCFRLTRNSNEANELLREPVPEIMIVDCPDEVTWRKLLLQSNARKNGETEKQVIFLRNQSDFGAIENRHFNEKNHFIKCCRSYSEIKKFYPRKIT